MNLKDKAISPRSRRRRTHKVLNDDHHVSREIREKLPLLPVAVNMCLPASSHDCARVPSLNSIPGKMDPRAIRWKSDNMSPPSLSQSQNSCPSSYCERNRSNYNRTNDYSCDSSFDNFDVNLGFSLPSSDCANHTSSVCNKLLISSWNHDFVFELWRFMVRLTGRCLSRRFLTSNGGSHWIMSSAFLYAFVAVTAGLFIHVTEACSSRSTPKPRPPSPTLRPNITIQTYTCPPEYDAHYCLNGASCFTVKIGDSILYNCECAEGYMGQRCEFKDLEGSYLPSKQRAMLEQAGITSGVVVIIILVVFICSYLYIRSRRKPPSKGDIDYKCPANAIDRVDSTDPASFGLVLPERSKEKKPFSSMASMKIRDC